MNASNLNIGAIVTVYFDPLTEKQPEGQAKLLFKSTFNPHSDALVFFKVEFVSGELKGCQTYRKFKVKEVDLEIEPLRCNYCGGLLGSVQTQKHDNPDFAKYRVCKGCGYQWAKQYWRYLFNQMTVVDLSKQLCKGEYMPVIEFCNSVCYHRLQCQFEYEQKQKAQNVSQGSD